MVSGAYGKHLGNRVEKLPMKYSGLPLGVSWKSIKCWTLVLDKIKERLAIWRCKLLSQSSRI